MHKYHENARRMMDRQIRNRGISDPAVLDAMVQVPRHRFVPDCDPVVAYADRALPTLEGQTISQPYMVAAMTEQLHVVPGVKVLEIGTGSGYQSAILAHLGAKIITLERHEDLADPASKVLDELGWSPQIQVIVADGTLGYPPDSPFDRILVTAAAPKLPLAYQDQLADGGRIVIPIGSREEQTLMTFQRQGDHWTSHSGIRCRFVPLIGVAGWQERSA